MEEEFAPDAGADVVDNRPLEERIGDKNWKARIGAYDELKKLVSAPEEERSSTLYSDYAQWLTKMTADTHAGALDSGFDAALAFLDTAPAGSCSVYYDKLFSNIVDKTFSARASTVTKGKALMQKMMEVDETSACVAFLLTKLADKKPKIPPTCLDVIKEGIELYGIKAFPVKDIVKALPAVFNGTNSGARDSAMALIVEIYRWIRLPPLQSMLDGLRTAQKSDFEKIIAEKSPEFTSVTPEPTLYLRKERPSEEAIAAKATAAAERAASGAPVSAAVPEGADGREYVEEVDLMKKLKNTEYSTLIAEEKWSEQLKGLQLVIDAIGPVPKIKPGNDVHDLIQTLKSFLRQGHLQLQVSSLKILCLLADGLRKEFGSVLRPIMQQVIQKSKEKRLVVEVQAVLNIAFLHCLTYDHCADDILEFVSSKKSPPHGKIGLLEVVVKTFTTLADKVSSDALKPLASALITECDDADPKVREAAVNALASIVILAKSRGRLAGDVTKVISNLETGNAKVHKKVMTAVDVLANGGSASNTSADPMSESLKSKSSVGSGLVKKLSATSNTAAPASVPKAGGTVTMNATTGTVSIKKTSAAPSASATSGANTTKRAASAPAEDDQMEDITLSLEEAIVQLEPMQIPGWSETGLAAMESAKWQDKVEGLGVIENRLNELADNGGAAIYSAALIKYIAATSGNFKISNANILKATIQTCTALVRHSNPAINNTSGKFSRAAGWELLKNLGDKLSDKKNKDVVQGLLTALAETCSPTFVIKRMKAVLDKCISPAAHQYYLEWLKDCIGEFGCHNVPIPFVCTVCQGEIENKNAAVRTAAVECVGRLYNQVGPRLTAIAINEDMKAAVKALLEAEFTKVGYDPSAANSAPKASLISGGGPSSSAGGASGGASSASDGAIPRQDLSAMVDKNILTELACTDSKTSWMRRKAAMESIIAACERSAHYLEANKPTGEIVKALKPRMTDTQANLKPVAVACIGHIVASLNINSGSKVLATMASAMCIGLADNKKSMRDSTILALQHAVSGACPAAVAIESDASMNAFVAADTNMLMATIPAAAESLINIVGRLELLLFLNHHVLSLKGDLSELVKPLVETIQDKSAAVRATGEALLTALLAHNLTTKTALDKHTRDLPPATKRAMQASIDRMMAAHGTAPARPVAAAPVAASAPAPVAATPAPAPAVPKTRPVPVVQEEAESVAEVRVPAKKAAVVESPPTPPRATPAAASAAIQNSPPLPAQATRAAVDPVLPPTPPHTTASTANTTVSASSTNWLLRRNLAGKLRRTEQSTLSWPQPPDAPSDTEIAALKVVWRPIVTPDLAFLLFPIVRPGSPVNQDIYVPAMNELSTQLTCPYLTHHTEFLLRWICIVLCLKHESSPGLLRLLQLVCDLFESIGAESNANNANNETGVSALTEAEVLCILPHLVDRAGHKSDRHAQLIVYAITLMCSLTPPKNVMHHLAQGLHSHNKRTRVVCLEEMSRMIEMYHTAVVGAPIVHSVVAYLDSRDCDVAARNACLDVLAQVFGALHSDLPKFKKLLGNDVSDRTMTMIEEKLGVAQPPPAAVATPAHASHAVARTPAVKSAVKSHTPAVTASAPASHAKSPAGPSIDTSNAVEAWDIQADASMVSPNTAQRTDKILLEQIDSVMASTPLPAHRAKQEPPFQPESAKAVSDAGEEAGSEYTSPVRSHVSTVSTPLTKQSVSSPLTTHSAAAPSTAAAPTPAVQAPQTAQSTRSTASVDTYEQHDTISALPVEFRSPVTSPVVQKFKNRLSMSGLKKEQGEENNAVAELDGLYLDIEQKIDALLHTSHAVATTDTLQEECKDYLKMLHSIVNGEWSTEVNVEDDKVLFSHSDALIVRLVGCIERSFVLPAVDPGNSPHANSIPGVDVSLLAISLSVLFSMVKRSEVSAALTEHTLFVVFHECLLRICDTRITSLATLHDATTTNESKETAQQIARALNNIVLKVGMNGTAGPVLLAMLRVMFCCIPVAELPHYPDHKPLPTSSTKPASRLVIQILSEHGNKSNPYSEPEVQLVPLLQAIHLFFTRHPTSTSNDTPFRTVKTVLNEIVLVKGGNYVLSVLYTTPIPHTAFIYLLTCRLGNVTMKPAASPERHVPSAVQSDTIGAVSSPAPAATLSAADTNAIHAAIVACIDDITSSRDKLAAIKQLHKIKAANPSIDINTYLLKISTAFRRYVLNTLAKLDGETNTAEINTSTAAAPAVGTPTKTILSSIGSPAKSSASPVAGAVTAGYAVDTPAAHEYASARSTPHTVGSVHTTNSLDYSPVSQVAPSESNTPQVSAYASASADPANEAMRILEGIKARPTQLACEAPGGVDATHRSYSLASPKGGAGSISPTTPTGSSIDTRERELTAGKHKRFAYNPETKRMEIVMVSSMDASPNNSPTHLSMALAGENSPFARRNDIIRNSLSSLTASLDHLPRTTSGEFPSTTSGVAIDEENLEARIQKLLSPKGGSRVPDL